MQYSTSVNSFIIPPNSAVRLWNFISSLNIPYYFLVVLSIVENIKRLYDTFDYCFIIFYASKLHFYQLHISYPRFLTVLFSSKLSKYSRTSIFTGFLPNTISLAFHISYYRLLFKSESFLCQEHCSHIGNHVNWSVISGLQEYILSRKGSTTVQILFCLSIAILLYFCFVHILFTVLFPCFCFSTA